MDEIMHSDVFPFTEEQLLSHFAEVRQNGKCTRNARHLYYYKNSIKRYREYAIENPDRRGKSLKEMKWPCQIEKDERFWIARSLMTIFYDSNRLGELIRIFRREYGDFPPVDLDSWQECFGGKLFLFFEPNLPSPKPYKDWLRQNLKNRHLIPYVLDSANGKKNLEGPTNVDALLLNPKNGFSGIFEAKILSDIAVQISYDILRNQIARNIDVMLEKNDVLCPPLNKRNPERTLFSLITPKTFREDPTSRLYGYKMIDYRNNPHSIGADLPHRNCNWEKISKRLGWLTWADLEVRK